MIVSIFCDLKLWRWASSSSTYGIDYITLGRKVKMCPKNEVTHLFEMKSCELWYPEWIFIKVNIFLGIKLDMIKIQTGKCFSFSRTLIILSLLMYTILYSRRHTSRQRVVKFKSYIKMCGMMGIYKHVLLLYFLALALLQIIN